MLALRCLKFRFTALECLALVAVVTLLVALLLPAVQSAWSGERVVPVLVQVFNAATGEPISGARVAIVNGPPPPDFRAFLPDGEAMNREEFPATDIYGRVLVPHTFPASGARHGFSKRSWVHLQAGWVCVSAEGYGLVVIPVRHGVVRREEILKSSEVRVMLGLYPANAVQPL